MSNPVCVVTGSGGLIGSETVGHFAQLGFDVVGIENDMRAAFFGAAASTAATSNRLSAELGDAFRHAHHDIRDQQAIDRLFADLGTRVEIVVHTAAQPSHDWAARDPFTDFGVNATGTLNLLQAVRDHCPSASFIFCSTNKVYGDTPNFLPLEEGATRLQLPESHKWHRGIGTDMSIDHCTHSLFGASKSAADLLVQEYGRYFEIPTVCFRGGCLTGPQHAGAKLHGFLSYLMRCTTTGDPYTVFGYGGKQVRDNIHACDVVRAFEAFHRNPSPAKVYNLGGGPRSNVSMLEAIGLCEKISGRTLDWTLSDDARVGDHRWWVSDIEPFKRDFPGWDITVGIEEILREIHDENAEAWIAGDARPGRPRSVRGSVPDGPGTTARTG